MQLLESAIEVKVTQYAEQKGCLALKLNILGRRGWPDRLYLYAGRVLFIEFKRPGEKPRKLQEYIHDRIRRQGFDVALVDNIREGQGVIDKFAQGDHQF
jgi:hypothetical protein